MLSAEQLMSASDPICLVVSDLIERVNSAPRERQPQLAWRLSRGQRVVWGWFVVQGEVNNGGFTQFFWNDSRRYVDLAREAFEILGATEHLDVLNEAVARHDGATERLRRYADRGTLEAFSESYREGVFDDLDRRYFALDCAPRLIEYIRQHPDEFVE